MDLYLLESKRKTPRSTVNQFWRMQADYYQPGHDPYPTKVDKKRKPYDYPLPEAQFFHNKAQKTGVPAKEIFLKFRDLRTRSARLTISPKAYLLAREVLGRIITPDSIAGITRDNLNKLISSARKKAGDWPGGKDSGPRDISSISMEVPTQFSRPDLSDMVTPRAIQQVVTRNKHQNLHDPLIMYSGEPEYKPYYLLTRLHREGKVGSVVRRPSGKRAESTVYELVVPAEFNCLAGNSKLRSLVPGTIRPGVNFKKIYRKDAGSLHVIHTMRTRVKFSNIIAPLMRGAWKKGNLYFIQQEKLNKYRKALKHIVSPEDKKTVENLIQVHEALLSGKVPNRHLQALFPSMAIGWPKVARKMGESATWYLWLLAAEHEYGVLLPSRLKYREAASETKTHVKGKTGTQPIRQRMEHRSNTWDQDLLYSLGLGRQVGDPQEALRRHLPSTGECPIGAGDSGLNNLWVIAPMDYLRKHRLVRSPSEITDAIQTARKHTKFKTRDICILGKEGGRLKIKANRDRFEGYLTKLGTNREYMLVEAQAWLSLLDSPHHYGERLEHTPTGPKIVRGDTSWQTREPKGPKPTGNKIPKETVDHPSLSDLIQSRVALSATLDDIEKDMGYLVSPSGQRKVLPPGMETEMKRRQGLEARRQRYAELHPKRPEKVTKTVVVGGKKYNVVSYENQNAAFSRNALKRKQDIERIRKSGAIHLNYTPVASIDSRRITPQARKLVQTLGVKTKHTDLELATDRAEDKFGSPTGINSFGSEVYLPTPGIPKKKPPKFDTTNPKYLAKERRSKEFAAWRKEILNKRGQGEK